MTSDGDQSRLVDEAYRPPTSEPEPSAGNDGRDAAAAHRVAGTYLLILAIVHGVVWAARLVLNLPVSWFAPTHAVVQLALGVGLRRSSAVALRVGTILLQVGADALFTAPQVARAFREGMPAVVLLPPILGVTLRAVPFALLLLGKPGSARRRAAVALAAFQLIVEVVATIAGVVAAKGILPGRHR